MNSMRKITYILFLGIFTGLYAQTGANPNPINTSIDMYPKTPEATALSKFVDIPAGNYTGVADFTIPLYTIEFDGQKIPIELKYTTTGIKVGQIATRVGLGWVLNTGPSLSQQVIGFRDVTLPRPVYPTDQTFYPHQTNYEHYRIALRAAGLLDRSDMKPDLFTYNLLNKSGKYILNAQGTYGIPLPYNQIKITPVSHFYHTEIIDEAGFQYTFRDFYGSLKTKNTCTENFVNPDFDYPDPNYTISEIQSPTNEMVKYIYAGNSISATYVSSISTQKRIGISVSGLGPGETVPPESTRHKCINYTHESGNTLKEIQFKGGKIIFTYNNSETDPRLDIKGDWYVKNIKVVNDRSEVIKDFTLNYDYFISPGEIPSVPGHTSSPYTSYLYGVNRRLKLLSVKDNLTNSMYLLEYYESYAGKSLPNRISNDQDFWGVYNGKENGIKSISNSIYAPVPSHIQSPYFGADKNADLNFGKLGNLKRITYPTGGYTEIQYEADEFDLTMPEVIYDYTEEPFQYYVDNVANPPARLTFTITENPANQEIEFKKVTSNPTTTIGPCSWKLKKPDGTIESSFINGTFSRNDPPGNYELWVEKDEMPSIKCYAYYRWTDFIKTPMDTIYSRKLGTIRVSKIESIDNNGGKIERLYSYKEPTANHVLPYTKGSGKNVGEELFIPRSVQQYPNGTQGYYATEIIASDNPGWQIATVRGKPIGYSYVQEHYIDHVTSANSYRKEFTFKNDEGSTYYDPNTPVNVTWPYLGLDRGLLLEEYLFDSSNRKIKSIVNEYQYDGHFNSKYANTASGYYTMGIGLEIIPLTHNVTRSSNTYTFKYVTFNIDNYWLTEKKTTVTDYTASGDELITEKTYKYSVPEYKHTFPTETSTQGSMGETLKTVYQYPQDIAAGNPQYAAMQGLITRNQISDPVMTRTLADNIASSEIKTIYSQFNSGTDTMILPASIYLKKGENATAADRKITYNAYDTNGNLTQYTMENGIPVSVIWGYNKTQPIAKIEGATNAQISPYTAYLLLASEIDNNPAAYNLTAADAEANMISNMDAFRKTPELAAFHITTYSYSPLVGVKTVTPPSGIREYYFYDTAQRLQSVKIREKDPSGNDVYRIIKEYRYNYQQP